MGTVEGLTRSFDCIIAGAGPGGAYLGYLLSSLGLKCLILEKKSIPRYKPCGGGLTKRALDLLPFDLTGIVEDWAVKARLCFGGGFIREVLFDQPVIGLVMRSRLDSFLVSKAQEAGAVVLTGVAFKDVKAASGGSLEVQTTAGDFKALVLAGADGAGSRTARALGLWKNRVGCPAVEAEVYPLSRESLDAWRGMVEFDFSAAPKGYGWVFPKADHLSVGVF
ncbi:MAG: FAD-dependent monooxygenase, partial [Dissulfurimicrobium sp.]